MSVYLRASYEFALGSGVRLLIRDSKTGSSGEIKGKQQRKKHHSRAYSSQCLWGVSQSSAYGVSVSPVLTGCQSVASESVEPGGRAESTVEGGMGGKHCPLHGGQKA